MMGSNNINQALKNFEIQAEMQAIRNIEALKLAGLTTPSPSPVKNSKKAGRLTTKKVVASRPVPVLTFSPVGGRARINKKLCSSYKKDELMNVMRRLGHRVDARMTLKEMCGKLKPATRAVSVYKRPLGNSIVNVRKQTYPKVLRVNLYKLGKFVKVPVLSKNKKNVIVNKIYKKLDANIKNALKKSNKKTVTARQIAEKLAHEYGWKNDRHVERLRVLKTFQM